MEKTGDSLLRQLIRIKDRQQPRLDIGPVVSEDRRGKSLLAGEIRVERSFRHAGCVGDVFDAAGRESARTHKVDPRLEQTAAHVRV